MAGFSFCDKEVHHIFIPEEGEKVYRQETEAVEFGEGMKS